MESSGDTGVAIPGGAGSIPDSSTLYLEILLGPLAKDACSVDVKRNPPSRPFL